MLAVIKREMRGYFSSAIGYIFLAVYFVLAAFFFMMYNLAANTPNMASTFRSMVLICTLLVPILTMRLMCEEKKQKTDQLLLTSPVSLTGIVMGKFLAAFFVFAIGLASFVVFALTMALYVNVDTFTIIGNIVGMLLLGAALIGIGLFISNLTESQVISGVASLFVMLMLYFLQSLGSSVNNAFAKTLFNSISIYSRFDNFAVGILNLGDAVYFFSVAAVFIFLTIRVLEKRRWS